MCAPYAVSRLFDTERKLRHHVRMPIAPECSHAEPCSPLANTKLVMCNDPSRPEPTNLDNVAEWSPGGESDGHRKLPSSQLSREDEASAPRSKYKGHVRPENPGKVGTGIGESMRAARRTFSSFPLNAGGRRKRRYFMQSRSGLQACLEGSRRALAQDLRLI